MKRAVLVLFALVLSGIVLGAFAVRAAQGPAQESPTFRSGVDVIRLDVSVLDKDRHPVRGLSAADFTVLENGKPQRIVTTSEVDVAEKDPSPSARIRYVPRDVAANDVADQIGDGRLFAIIIDDKNIPSDSLDIVMATREAARYVIDGLGPSDLAAVVYARESGWTQDFTNDRTRLLAAIDHFSPRPLPFLEDAGNLGSVQGDVRRYSPTMVNSMCLRAEPVIPAISTVVSRLSTVTNRRKTVMLMTVGIPVNFAGRGCDGALAGLMQDAFRNAQRTNVNIDTIDPSGYDGYAQYLRDVQMRGGREFAARGYRFVSGDQSRHDFVRVTAETTGGRAVFNTDAIEPAINLMFDENSAYYLVGYQTSNGSPDGKFRKIEVRVTRKDATVHTRSGFWAPSGDDLINPKAAIKPTGGELALTGMLAPQNVPLLASALPLSRSDPGGRSRNVDVVLLLTVRVPSPRVTVPETLTLTRTVYDADGRAGPPVQEIVRRSLDPVAGDVLRYDILRKVSLAPGRYQIRFNAHSAVLDASGSVYADVEVPDFTQPPLQLSAVAIGALPTSAIFRSDALAEVLPLVPTTARDFAPSDKVTAFLRVFQGSTAPSTDVVLTTEVLDLHDIVKHTATATLASAAFDATGGAHYQVELPLATLAHGPYLLSITARLPGGRMARRDVIFRVQ